MDAFQEALNRAVKDIPAVFLEILVSKKLEEQGITAPRALSRKLARHILSGNRGTFRYKSRKYSGNVHLAFDEADANEIGRACERFQNEQLPKILPKIAERVSKSVLTDLKSRWPNEYSQQATDLAGFRQRLEERWGMPLGQLRMLLTMSREWCESVHNRKSSLKPGMKKQLRTTLIRLLVRGCQVTDEIVCLLENGFADGAMARWRTLHEIAVVAVTGPTFCTSASERVYIRKPVVQFAARREP